MSRCRPPRVFRVRDARGHSGGDGEGERRRRGESLGGSGDCRQAAQIVTLDYAEVSRDVPASSGASGKLRHSLNFGIIRITPKSE